MELCLYLALPPARPQAAPFTNLSHDSAPGHRQVMWNLSFERETGKALQKPHKMAQFTGILLCKKRLSRSFLHGLPDSQVSQRRKELCIGYGIFLDRKLECITRKVSVILCYACYIDRLLIQMGTILWKESCQKGEKCKESIVPPLFVMSCWFLG